MSVPRDSVLDGHDGVLCDLDGVVYAGDGALPDAVESLQRVAADGLPIGFVTNNASRPPETVADHLRSFGLDVDASQVFGSAAAGARLARADAERRSADGELHPAPWRAMVVGAAALADAVREAGFEVVSTASRDADADHADAETADAPDYVVQGFDPHLRWTDLAAASYALQAGARWVATNTDMTIPRAEGTAPGNGSLVAAVGQTVDVTPLVAGKPEPALMQLAAEQLGLRNPLVIGDRLDTDIAGGVAADFDTALVLTGVDTEDSAAAAEAAQRPTYVLRTLADLYEPARALGEAERS